MSNIEKIRQEIERRKKENMYDELPITIGRYYEDRDLLAFIDSLPEEKLSYVTDSPGDPGNPGEPGISNLEEAAEELFETIEIQEHENIFEDTFKKIFIAGAEWQKEQMELDGIVTLTESDFDAEKEKASEWGYNLCKEQMTKNAVTGEIVKDISNMLAVTAKNINLDGFKFGDKVKIIIIKDND